MNPIATQQAALNNALFPSKKRLKIKICNATIAFTNPQKEETYQVTLEALKLSLCYPAFQINAETLCIKLTTKISSARKEHMPYPRFTKVIINHFISKDNTISIRNRINLHIVCDDTSLGKFLLKRQRSSRIMLLLTQDYPVSPKEPTQKSKQVKKPAKKATTALTTSVVIKDTPDKYVSKKIVQAKADRGKCIELLSDAALLKDAQLKKILRKIKQETHKLQACGSSKGADFKSEVPDEQTDKTKDISNGTGVKPGVLDVSKEDSFDSDNDSWGNSEDESDDVQNEDDNNDDDGNDDDSGNDDDGGEEEQYEEYVYTLEKDKSDDEEKMYEKEDDDVTNELYRDLNITRGFRDANMTNVVQGGADQHSASHESGFMHEKEYAHVTLTTVHDKTNGLLQSSSISSDFASKLLNLDDPYPYINSLMDTLTVPPPPPPVNPSSHLTTITPQPTTDSTTTTTNPTMSLPEIPNLAQLAKVVSLILGTVDNYLASKLKEEANIAVRLQSNKLREEAQAVNQEFPNQVDSTMKAIIKDQVKAQVSKIMPQIKKYVIESLGAEVLVRSTNQPRMCYAVEASLLEFKLKKILDEMIKTKIKIPPLDQTQGRKEESKSTQVEEQEFEAADTELQQDQGNESGHLDDQPANEAAPKHDWFQKPDKPPTLDHPWNKSKSIDFRPPQKWICTIAKECYKARQHSSHRFSRACFQPLLKGSCKIFVELEYHFKECYKSVNDRLDWHNLEGREYPFDLSKPLPLIKDQGRQVVPGDYFINNDLEYLKGGSSSSKYATSKTRTKAAKYNNIEGIEDMVPTLWSPVKVAYNKHDVWGTYHYDSKRQRFYAYACHWKYLHDVYAKRRIIAVTNVKVMRWYDYGYLEKIVVRRDDNVLNKFKEGNFLRLNLCDIEDMLLDMC
nr:hypothetical protein [Tanacetum cinerariifolium]